MQGVFLTMRETNITMALGAIVVMVVVVLGLNVVRTSNKRPQISATKTEVPAIIPKEEEGRYEVDSGDSLWAVAKKTYGNGHQWERLWQYNMETVGVDPNIILAGTTLKLPRIDSEGETTEHEIQKGDSLWKIAVRLCQNGYEWTKIARDNGIWRPDLIYAGDKLKIECE